MKPKADEEGSVTEQDQRQATNGAPKVLVVEDELLIRWSLREALLDAGFEVLEAESASEARARFSEKPDAAILDLRLPDADGTALLRELVADSTEGVVSLMISAYATPEMVQAAKTAGAFDLVAKPFKVERIVEILEEAMAVAKNEAA